MLLITEKVKRLTIQILYINREGMNRKQYLDIVHSGKTPTKEQIRKHYKLVHTHNMIDTLPETLHNQICNLFFANFQLTDFCTCETFIVLKIRSMMIGDIVQIDESQYMCGNGFDWKLII